MMTMGWIAQLIAHDQVSSHIAWGQPVRKIVTDTRLLQTGDFFVALKGQHVDGHDFVRQAFKQGAIGAMVNQDYPCLDERVLPVADTYHGLGRMAQQWRKLYAIPVVGITGSNGKTTVKNMLASILSVQSSADAVWATPGNFNNHVGLPLTLLGLTSFHQYAVIEMGMSHAGEIAYLAQLTHPTIAMVLNARHAHMGGGFSSLRDIATAKAEIFEALDSASIAIIPAADPYTTLFDHKAQGHTRYHFGLHQGDVYADHIKLNGLSSSFSLVMPQGASPVTLHVPGIHNICNALAAATAAFVMRVPLLTITQGLSLFLGTPSRLNSLQIAGGLWIDDTYNANPDSMKAAIDVLASSGCAPRILVMGDMAELGEKANQLHEDIGYYAKAKGINHLLTLGTLSRSAAKAFGKEALCFETIKALCQGLEALIDHPSTVLVKGSRAMKMERVMQYFSQRTIP